MLPNVSGRGFTRASDGDVILKMSQADYNYFLIAIGYFIGGMSKENERALTQGLEFINRINQGNEEFAPHKTTKEKEKK